MKKTLITLAALAMASVASAKHLDFTNLSGASEFTFDQPAWNTSTNSWEGSPSNTLTLTGKTTFDAANKTISNGTATVTYTNAVDDIFRVHNGSSDQFAGPYIMTLATINLGKDGSLYLDRNVGSGYNLGEMRWTVSGTLETIVYTDDQTLLAKGAEVVSRTLIQDLDKGAMWNREGNTNTVFSSLTFNNISGTAMTQVANGTTLTTTDTGKFVIANPNNYTMDVQYVVTYMAKTPVDGGTESVPEPTTATLSLLALAGLAARRRRK